MAKGFQTGPYEVMFYFALREGPAYGYELAMRFRKMTQGHVKIQFWYNLPFPTSNGAQGNNQVDSRCKIGQGILFTYSKRSNGSRKSVQTNKGVAEGVG